MKLFLLLLFVSTFGVLGTSNLNLPKSANKTIDKTLEAYWPGQDIDMQLHTIAAAEVQKVTGSEQPLQLYTLNKAGQKAGYLYIAEAPSKFETFTYMTVFNTDLSIKTIRVLVYREDQGGEISSKRWLKQFDDKKDPDNMQFGKQIRNISGATISARSITLGVQNQTRHMLAFQKASLL